MSFDDALDNAALGFRDISVCLSGPLRHQWETRKQAIALLADEIEREREEPGPDQRLGQKSEALKTRETLEAELQDLLPKMRAASVTLRFTALDFNGWNELVLAHPPREGNLTDRAWGYNTLSFYPAAMRLTGQAVEDGQAVDVSSAQWDRLEKVLTDAVMDDVANAINTVNRREGAGVPFSLADSATTPD
jgi:hypothetical protein